MVEQLLILCLIPFEVSMMLMSPVAPVGVLKKPGSLNRSGPKHMKKVAFLENAEFSRGIP